MRERAVVGQEQQAFGIAVEPPGRVGPGQIEVVRERATPCAVGELAQDVVRLVEQNERGVATAPA